MGVRIYVCIIVYIEDMQCTSDGGVSRAGEEPPGGFNLSTDRPKFAINIPKLITTPAQQIEHLGLMVDSTSLHLSLSGEKPRLEIDQITLK